MRNILLGLLVAAAAAAAAVILLRGGSSHHAAPPATAPKPAGAAMTVEAYFFRGAALEPAVVRVPRTRAVATAALRALFAGPPAGWRTSIPTGARLVRVELAGGTATAVGSSALASARRTAQAQIVETLTQFPTVSSVRISAGGKPVPLVDGSGARLTRPASRDDYADLRASAPIFVSAPLRDATVSSPVRVAGTASVFEATLVLELWSGEKRLERRIVTASAGAPERGTWTQTLALAPASYRLVLYEPSAENGAPLHTTTVDFRVKG